MGQKKIDADRLGFIDIFVSGTNENGIKSSVILELKCVSLAGLLSRVKGRWVRNTEYKSLKELDEELEREAEYKLL